MERITYGAPGYMDWVAQIKAGAARVRVHFTGGALTVYGVTPAEYTTDNAFIQKAIEKSEYYKAGRIVKLRAVTVEGLGAGSAEHKGIAPGGAGQAGSLPSIEGAASVESVKVSCLQDAQAYIQEHFGISSYKVRTEAAAQKIAAEHGIEFSF